MKKIVEILSIFGIIVSISIICDSCKTINKENDSDLAALVECSCDDMACWSKKTDEKFWGSVKCAGEAAALATGLTIKKKIQALVKSGKEVSKALEYAKKVAGNAGDAAESFTDLSSFTDPAFWLSVGTSVSGDFELKRQNIECGKNFAELATGAFLLVFGAVNAIIDLFSTKVGDDEDSVAKLADVTLNGVKNSSTGLSQSKSMAAAISLGFATCKSCFSAIKNIKSTNPKILYLQSIMPAIEAFLENALVVFVLADCGYQITSSSIYLLANTKCLASDLTTLADSYKAVERMNDKVLSNQLDCDQENASSCSYEIARRYGISLGKMISNQSWPTYWSKGSRAYQCYRYCYTDAGSKEQCYSVSLGDDLKNKSVCQKKCEQQTGDCLSFCASYCCKQDSNCTNEVHKLRK